MLGIGPLFIISLGVFSLSAWVVSLENRKQKRIFMPHTRDVLDRVVEKLTAFLVMKLTYLGRHIIKLSWYYSIHKLLRVILTVLVRTYDFLETAFMSNRDRARKLKIEKRSLRQSQSHLGQVAANKATTALSEKEKKDLLQKKLERE